ncbi:MAG: hypothetical protein AAGI66_09585, partial [Cyanobacteria bacterium P01_H01_bin.74]
EEREKADLTAQITNLRQLNAGLESESLELQETKLLLAELQCQLQEALKEKEAALQKAEAAQKLAVETITNFLKQFPNGIEYIKHQLESLPVVAQNAGHTQPEIVLDSSTKVTSGQPPYLSLPPPTTPIINEDPIHDFRPTQLAPNSAALPPGQPVPPRLPSQWPWGRNPGGHRPGPG